MTINSDWLEFLKQQTAHVNDTQVVEYFDNTKDDERRAATSGNILCELTHLGYIKVSGEEAQSFLQNQLSNDINQVSPQHSQLNAYCNAKGRALALFHVIQFNDAYYLQLPVELIATTLKRLQMFVLRSKVTLQDASDELITCALAGPNAATLLAELVTEVPEQVNQSACDEGIGITRVRGQQPRFLIYGDFQNLTGAWNRLKEGATVCSHHAWSLLDIHAGVPQIYAANVEAFVPQMMNLHSIDGISFQKGCYPGQEVVARMYFLGKLKRRMYLSHVDSEQPARPGDSLFNQDSNPDQAIGRVVDAQPAENGGYDLLAVLQISNVESDSVHLNNPGGEQLTFIDLPYTVALEREKDG
ncbi:MAG: folate-binding protein [Gammaproteobacteria bacterium]|jgi:folate-binding protein YgfZ